MPFRWAEHLVRILTTCYLPVTAFVPRGLARATWRSTRRPSVLPSASTCFFFLGINTVSVKLADPYGHDIDDLRIIAHCSAMPGACRALLTASLLAKRFRFRLLLLRRRPPPRPQSSSSSSSAAGATGSPTRRSRPPGGAPSRRSRCQCFPTPSASYALQCVLRGVLALALDFSPPSRHACHCNLLHLPRSRLGNPAERESHLLNPPPGSAAR